ncbi:unnamed protein product [Effrenium voratum]|uniref:Alpha-amylase n=1 Tax=Effrenium voratum TaxID=2562239 RepID=A0AA36NG42_9DINO|nr:unnamed protein product [Effrenium voratum]CAJ1437579.1 unnamed protein product [Effrenium voratum]
MPVACVMNVLRWLVRRCRRRLLKGNMSVFKANGRTQWVKNINGEFPLRTGLDYDLANDGEDRRKASCWAFLCQDTAVSDTTEETASPDLSEDGMSEGSRVDGPPQPRTIFHALHYTFEELRRILPELALKGFDAVQIPPAHISPQGDLRRSWFLRYQPLSYQDIDPALGGAEGLWRLCEEAADFRIIVIADCVFNHMAVVASCQEWQQAQWDGGKMEELQQRLDHTFGPHLNRHDFQWPWICLENEKWDDPHYMFEGWGCGEWSELSCSEKVISQHMGHLQQLLDCGVKGVRLDAAKHMRPQHVGRYVDFVQDQGGFVYAEVLSMDKQLHSQYEKLGKGVPSTDFALAASLVKAWRQENGGQAATQLQAIDHLGSHAVQFVRNHDTMFNEGPICGIDWANAEEAALAWAYLIAKNEGSLLIHQDDIHPPIVQAALAFRSDLSSVAVSASPYPLKTELVAWPPPSYETLSMLLTLADCPVGLAVFNLSSKQQRLEVPWSLEDFGVHEVRAGNNEALGGHLAARSARFFLLESAAPVPNPDVQYMTLFYFSTWEHPHIHFCVDHAWTAAPGWALRKSEKPAVRGIKIPRNGGRWWRVDVPLRAGPVEFVLNDGRGSWDNHPSSRGNYVAEMPGLHILVDKSLASLCL